jgi:curved DNA-binding protein CbpA
MSDANFYQVLGIGRSASADEIKSAYRERVKRYHPDLFPTAGAKAEATEKLRQINEAYAVLGNAEQRHRYDQEFIQKPQTRAHAPAAAKPRRTSRPPRHANLRSKTAKILKGRLYFSKKRAGYALAAAIVVLVLIYAGRSEPRLVTAWTLVEKLEVSPAKSISPLEGAGQGWVRLGQYASVSECAGILKQRVRKDEQEGSRAVFDEQTGTMAITVYVKKETAQARDDFKSAATPERSSAVEGASKNEQRQLEQRATEEGTKSFPQDGVTKRVRSLECREAQRWESESWLRQTLRRMVTLLL